MDIRMPVMDGYEAVKSIRELEASDNSSAHRTVIIALTASVAEERLSAVLDAGCDDFLMKPFREQDMFERIQKHLGVTYICEDLSDKEQRRKPELSAESLAALPPDLLAELEDTVIIADMEKLSELFEKIASLYDEKLANTLEYLTDNFYYSDILEMIKKIDN
jgi:DNA-binding response OmpR family regulator